MKTFFISFRSKMMLGLFSPTMLLSLRMQPRSSGFATTRHAPTLTKARVLLSERLGPSLAGLSEKLWPYAAQHRAMALNLSTRFDTGQIPWTKRFGENFSGRIIPFGAKVLFWNNPKQNVTDASSLPPKARTVSF